MGTAVRPAKTSPGPWDAFADVDVFVDEVLAELEAMAKDGARPMRSGPKPPLAGAARRKAVMAIWCICFCGMQWRAIGQLCDIPFGTLYGLFARWTRLGLWRRLLDWLRRSWRRACGDSPEPSAVVIDSRSCRSAPSCFENSRLDPPACAGSPLPTAHVARVTLLIACTVGGADRCGDWRHFRHIAGRGRLRPEPAGGITIQNDRDADCTEHRVHVGRAGVYPHRTRHLLLDAADRGGGLPAQDLARRPGPRQAEAIPCRQGASEPRIDAARR